MAVLHRFYCISYCLDVLCLLSEMLLFLLFQGCSTSLIQPFPRGKRPLTSPKMFIENNNNVSNLHINTEDNQSTDHTQIMNSSEDQSVNHNHIHIRSNSEESQTGFILPNGIITDGRTVSVNRSDEILLMAEAVDTSKVIPFIQTDQNSVTPSSRNSSGRSHKACQRLPNGMKTGGIKSVLKTGNPADHMLANRPIKTVTFVESVTVVTVM